MRQWLAHLRSDVGTVVFWIGVASLILGCAALVCFGLLVTPQTWAAQPFWTNVFSSATTALFGIPLVTIFASYLLRQSSEIRDRRRILNALISDLRQIRETVVAVVPAHAGALEPALGDLRAKMDGLRNYWSSDTGPHGPLTAEEKLAAMEWVKRDLEGERAFHQVFGKPGSVDDARQTRAFDYAKDVWRRVNKREEQALQAGISWMPLEPRAALEGAVTSLSAQVWHRPIDEDYWKDVVLPWFHDGGHGELDGRFRNAFQYGHHSAAWIVMLIDKLRTVIETTTQLETHFEEQR